jgi:DNA-binding transcriptional LysR family regulator
MFGRHPSDSPCSNVNELKPDPSELCSCQNSHLETITIHHDEMALIVAPSHALASRRSVKMANLEDEPFILHKIGTTTRERLVKHFSDGGVKMKVTMELASIETIKRFVSIRNGNLDRATAVHR